MALSRFVGLRVARRLRGGSSSPVVVETTSGTFVAKLCGSGGGVRGLVAEVIVAELAAHVGLAVPERVLIDLAPDVPSDDQNDELRDLLKASTGTNLGFRFLTGATEARLAEIRALDDEFVARVLWLDGLTMNPDRTLRNPNILFWNRQPWLIDHGAALSFHYDWRRVTEESPREVTNFQDHVFGDRVPLIRTVDAPLADSMTREVLDGVLARVPEELLRASTSEGAVGRLRAAYSAFLWKRLKAPRPFVVG